MLHKEVKCSDGIIKYRLPNIIEGMRLYGALGVDRQGSLKVSEIEALANIIEKVEPFITSIECESAKTWDELISNMNYLEPLTLIATEVLNSLNQEGAERKRRKKS